MKHKEMIKKTLTHGNPVHIEHNLHKKHTTVIEHELYYQKNGKYPNNSSEYKMPEDIKNMAIEVYERLIK